jgi:hypothetical protein
MRERERETQVPTSWKIHMFHVLSTPQDKRTNQELHHIKEKEPNKTTKTIREKRAYFGGVVVTRDGGYNVRDREQARGGWPRKRGCGGIYISRRRADGGFWDL